jgi:hypothetical protein
MKQTILILALVGCLSPGVAMAQAAVSVPVGTRVSTEADQPAQPHANAPVSADQGVEALLNLVLRQVMAGQTMAPEGDNAIFTWKRVLKVVVPRSPGTVKALSDFVAESHRRAAEEQAAGRTVTARELSIFADEASDMLKNEPPAAASAGQVSAPPPEVQRSDAPSAPQIQAEIRRSAEPAAADAKGNEAAPPGKPQTPPAGSGSAAAPAQMASRSAATIPAPSVAAPSPPATTAPRPAGPSSDPEQSAAAAAALSRGDAMLAMMNIVAARSFYEYAANAGNARAAAAMAETYDPVFLNRLGVVGIKPDPARAAEWYQKAAALGDRSAVARLQTLRADAAK